MSTAHDAHSAHAHDAHDFDNEPVKALPPDEPRTPGWIPALGLAIFVVVGIMLLAGSGDDASKPKTEGGSAGSQAAVAPPQQMGAPGQAPARPLNARPSALEPGNANTAIPAVQKLSPEQAKAIQQRIEEVRARQAAQGAQPGGAAPAPQPPTAPPPGGAR